MQKLDHPLLGETITNFAGFVGRQPTMLTRKLRVSGRISMLSATSASMEDI